jgi:hypothetical protein
MASLATVTEPAATAVTQHPAETSGVAGAVTLLIVHALGVTDVNTIVALGIVVGFIPAAVTWAVALWRKRNGAPPPTTVAPPPTKPGN